VPELDPKELINALSEFLALFGLRALGGLIVLLIGWKITNKIAKSFELILKKYQVEPSLISFLWSFILWSLRIILLISVASVLGVKTTSFIAVLGSAGLAIGLAIQGSLSNLAGGVLILLLRPFKVGDFIEVSGTSGTVNRIMLFHTVLNTIDNRIVFLPNGPLANSNIINFSAEATRRIDYNLGISYKDDLRKGKELLMNLALAESRILKEPAPEVMVASLGDSSVILRLRVWVETPNFWPVMFSLTEKSKLACDEQGLNIPFPQRDVHLFTSAAKE